jgi:hypothetical protein
MGDVSEASESGDSMSELDKILLTSGLTIAGGFLVYVFGQIATRFLIDPYHEYRKTVGEIADTLVYYANIYMNPGSGDRELWMRPQEVYDRKQAYYACEPMQSRFMPALLGSNLFPHRNS